MRQRGEPVSSLILWTLCQPDLMTKGAACSLIPCLQCQPLGRSTIIGQPLRLQGLRGRDTAGSVSFCFDPQLFKNSPTSACQSGRIWEEIIFHCHERLLSRYRSWTEKQGLERPFKILLLPSSEVLGLGHRRQQRCCINRRFLAASSGCWINFSSWEVDQFINFSHLRKTSFWARKQRNLWFCLPQPAERLIYYNNNNDFIIINH